MHCSPSAHIVETGTEMREVCTENGNTRGRDDDDTPETRPRQLNTFTMRDTMTTPKMLRTRSVAGRQVGIVNAFNGA